MRLFFIILLALAGLYIATYFTLVYYKVLEANTRLMPSVCRLEDRTCQTVLKTRFARVFGLPNSLLGVIYYIALIVVTLAGLDVTGLKVALTVTAWFTVALGILLTYSLLFIIKIPCPLCITAHLINLTLAVLLTVS